MMLHLDGRMRPDSLHISIFGQASNHINVLFLFKAILNSGGGQSSFQGLVLILLRRRSDLQTVIKRSLEYA